MTGEPRAMPSTTVAEALLVRLRTRGVDYLFANSGTDFPPVIEALARAHETGAAEIGAAEICVPEVGAGKIGRLEGQAAKGCM